MSIVKIKNSVREDVIVRLTFDGAFQRSKIYKKKVSVEKKKDFQDDRFFIDNRIFVKAALDEKL